MSETTRDLIAELEQGGELVDDGAFAIDAGQALVKLRDYQLAVPHAWILLVVEAAATAGVEPIVIPGEDPLRVELGALELDAAQLEQLFAWAFVKRDAASDPATRQRTRVLELLALACNALLGLRPDAIVIESAGASGGLRLRMTPAQPLGTIEASADLQPGTRLCVEGLAGAAERELVRARCRLTTLDVRIAAERVSRGPAGAIVDATFEAQREKGGFAPVGRTKPLHDAEGRVLGRYGRSMQVNPHPLLHIVTKGVTIESIDLRDESFGKLDVELDDHFVAVVDRDLPRDISQARVRRGPELAALVALVRKVAEHEPRAMQPRSRLGPAELASDDSETVRGSLTSALGIGVFVWVMSAAAKSVPWLIGSSVLVVVGIVALVRTHHRP